MEFRPTLKSGRSVLRIKPKFFGSTEESILISKVASAQISTGMSGLTSTLTRPGATNPNVSHGHSKTDAERIRQVVEHFQQSGSRSNS
jgi:hypothetical protein